MGAGIEDFVEVCWKVLRRAVCNRKLGKESRREVDPVVEPRLIY